MLLGDLTQPLPSSARTRVGIESRRAERHEVSFRSELRDGDTPGLPIHVVDISTSGFCARRPSGSKLGPTRVKLPGVGFIAAQIVWSLGGRIGGQFSRPLDPEVQQQILRSAPQQHSWQD